MKFGVTELLIILAIVLIIFGPKQIPRLKKTLKKSMKSFKKGAEAEKNDDVKVSDDHE